MVFRKKTCCFSRVCAFVTSYWFWIIWKQRIQLFLFSTDWKKAKISKKWKNTLKIRENIFLFKNIWHFRNFKRFFSFSDFYNTLVFDKNLICQQIDNKNKRKSLEKLKIIIFFRVFKSQWKWHIKNCKYGKQFSYICKILRYVIETSINTRETLRNDKNREIKMENMAIFWKCHLIFIIFFNFGEVLRKLSLKIV